MWLWVSFRQAIHCSTTFTFRLRVVLVCEKRSVVLMPFVLNIPVSIADLVHLVSTALVSDKLNHWETIYFEISGSRYLDDFYCICTYTTPSARKRFSELSKLSSNSLQNLHDLFHFRYRYGVCLDPEIMQTILGQLLKLIPPDIYFSQSPRHA